VYNFAVPLTEPAEAPNGNDWTGTVTAGEIEGIEGTRDIRDRDRRDKG
jgi:hypothetical protein